MSVKIKIASVEYNDYIELEESANILEEKLCLFKSRHPEFSYLIDRDIDKNIVTVKSCILTENSIN